jgi:hypothetical protein
MVPNEIAGSDFFSSCDGAGVSSNASTGVFATMGMTRMVVTATTIHTALILLLHTTRSYRDIRSLSRNISDQACGPVGEPSRSLPASTHSSTRHPKVSSLPTRSLWAEKASSGLGPPGWFPSARILNGGRRPVCEQRTHDFRRW